MNYYNLVLDLIEYNPGKFRFNCPGCSRQNSLAIYRQDGELSFHCYGNGCNVRGKQRQKLSVADIYNRKNKKIAEEQEFVCPEYWTQGLNREEVRKYLQSVHSFDAAIEGRVNIKYDPRMNRCVFLVYDTENKLVGATGRLLGKGTPKWLHYGSVRHPLICGNKDTAVLVEDPASAAAISHSVTGLAILGTDLNLTYIGILRRYKKIVIALDKDAVRKMIELESSIRYFADTSILMLEDDLKYFDQQAQRDMLGSKIDLENVQDL